MGLLWLFHVVPQVKGYSPHKYLGGHVDCQLAYSLNGWHFLRCLREPFIPNGEPGSPDSGCVYPTYLLQKTEDELWIYASACTHEHGYIPEGSGSLLTYRLRRDGFVYLSSCNGRGTVGTRPLHLRGGDVYVNVQCPAGEVRAQLTDSAGTTLEGYAFEDSEAFTGDRVDWSPIWAGGKSLRDLSGRAIRVELELTNGNLYALRGNFMVLTGYECKRFEKYGEIPAERPGF